MVHRRTFKGYEMKALIIGILGALVSATIVGFVALVAFAAALIAGTVLYFLWSWAAPLYFDFLPVKYITIPWFHVVLLTWLFSVIGNILFKSSLSTKSD
jgi:hypothetical protein